MSMALTYSIGTYRGRVTKWGLGKAGTGSPQFFVTLLILGKVDTSDSEAGLLPCPQYERTVFRAITDKTIDYLVNDLRKLGYDRDNFDDLNPESPNAFDFYNIEANVVCDHDTYQGKAKEKWSFGGGSFEAAPLEANKVKELNALFGKKFKETKPRTSPVNRAVTSPTVSDEEVKAKAATVGQATPSDDGSELIPF